MECKSAGKIRSSDRKTKRKTFEGFISTENLSSILYRKRRSSFPESVAKRKAVKTVEKSEKLLSPNKDAVGRKHDDRCNSNMQKPTKFAEEAHQWGKLHSITESDTFKVDSSTPIVAENESEAKTSCSRACGTTKKSGDLDLKVAPFDEPSSTSSNTHFKFSPKKDSQYTTAKRFSKKVSKDLSFGKDDSSKHICLKRGCGKTNLSCCIRASKCCMEASGKCSRWYHMSLEEHYCNGCFEEYYRGKNYGCEELHEWKKSWMQNSKVDSNFKNIATYIAEKQLPYWVECRSCHHWRVLANDVELTSDIIKHYVCSKGNMSNCSEQFDDSGRVWPHLKYSCGEPNDPAVEVASDANVPWMAMLNCPVLLKYSPAARFLTGYYPDGVGMSAVDTVRSDSGDDSFSVGDGDDDDVLRPSDLYDKLSPRPSSSSSSPAEGSGVNTEATSNGQTKQASKSDHTHLPATNSLQSTAEQLSHHYEPFYAPHERGKALCMRPDLMELDEVEEFPEYCKDPTTYVAMRNLIVALWTLDPRRLLTARRCCDHVIARGLSRVRLCRLELPRVLHFAVRKGLVNIGALGRPATGPGTLPDKFSNQKVIVVGTGPAGLSAARQLHNFGCDVTCLEARDRIGGRVHDDWSMDGVCVGRGAQIINGCVNNPLALISDQLDLRMHVLRARCDLFSGGGGKRGRGSPVQPTSDKRMEFHFNALLDMTVEWRQSQGENAPDCSLGDKIEEAHREWIKQSGLTFSKLEEGLLNFHLSNLEFACGTRLDQVSAFHWDQNEIFAQFNGAHTFVQYGFSTQLRAIAHGLDIRFRSPVAEISYDGDGGVRVTTSDGREFESDRVLVTVPLAVLRSGSIRFKPALPVSKQAAMERLGCGCIEKLALRFPYRFWDSKIDGCNYFGYVPNSSDKKGFFTVFYDVPRPKGEKSAVLMSVISGSSVDKARSLSDRQIIQVAMSILRNVFPEIDVPEPVQHFVTRWKDDEFAQMAYSFVKVGSSGDDYDTLADDVEQRVYFAGEGTNRHFPQTVTGAYLSGLREASKIALANARPRCDVTTSDVG